jgi:hypothetical protein
MPQGFEIDVGRVAVLWNEASDRSEVYDNVYQMWIMVIKESPYIGRSEACFIIQSVSSNEFADSVEDGR